MGVCSAMRLEVVDHFLPVEIDESPDTISAQDPCGDPVPDGAFVDFKSLGDSTNPKQ